MHNSQISPVISRNYFLQITRNRSHPSSEIPRCGIPFSDFASKPRKKRRKTEVVIPETRRTKLHIPNELLLLIVGFARPKDLRNLSLTNSLLRWAAQERLFRTVKLRIDGYENFAILAGKMDVLMKPHISRHIKTVIVEFIGTHVEKNRIPQMYRDHRGHPHKNMFGAKKVIRKLSPIKPLLEVCSPHITKLVFHGPRSSKIDNEHGGANLFTPVSQMLNTLNTIEFPLLQKLCLKQIKFNQFEIFHERFMIDTTNHERQSIIKQNLNLIKRLTIYGFEDGEDSQSNIADGARGWMQFLSAVHPSAVRIRDAQPREFNSIISDYDSFYIAGVHPWTSLYISDVRANESKFSRLLGFCSATLTSLKMVNVCLVDDDADEEGGGGVGEKEVVLRGWTRIFDDIARMSNLQHLFMDDLTHARLWMQRWKRSRKSRSKKFRTVCDLQNGNVDALRQLLGGMDKSVHASLYPMRIYECFMSAEGGCAAVEKVVLRLPVSEEL